MQGLITRIFAGRARSPAEHRRERLKQEFEAALAQRATERAARPERTEERRFAHARPMVERLALEHAMAPVRF